MLLGREDPAMERPQCGRSAAATTKKSSFSVKFQDLYNFSVEGSLEDVNVLNEVRERMRRHGRAWRAMETAKGPHWFDGLSLSLSISSSLSLSISSSLSLSVSRRLKLSAMADVFSLRAMIRKGVPMSLRPRVWLTVSGAGKKRSTVPESYYGELLRAIAGKVTPATLQIDRDLPRTFPGHPWINSAEGQASLRRVLVAYSFRDSNVGYCQGLNYVAGMLLLVMTSEEDAFWMLAVLVEDLLVNDCYADNLYGCHVEQRVFKALLAKKSRRIASHLETLGFDVSWVATEWFLCLFSKSLPSETTMRVWDVLFYEGAKVLFHVALALIKMEEKRLLGANQICDVIVILQKSTHRLYDPDELITVAFDKIGSMTTHAITKQRRKQKPAVMAELNQRLRRLSSLKLADQ
ncbi:uncharacterized protein LOC144709612 [Wolffia australiana]